MRSPPPKQGSQRQPGPMTVYGDGQQTRSFQYVSDLVAGLIALMDGNDTGPINRAARLVVHHVGMTCQKK